MPSSSLVEVKVDVGVEVKVEVEVEVGVEFKVEVEIEVGVEVWFLRCNLDLSLAVVSTFSTGAELCQATAKIFLPSTGVLGPKNGVYSNTAHH